MAKQRLQIRSLNMFEPQVAPSETATTQSTEPQTKVIKDACPRCGSRSLKTVRAFEHDGNTHYCAAGCLSEDRTDAFYFTPRVETFDEQAEREEAKRTLSEDKEMDKALQLDQKKLEDLGAFEVETEALPEGEQVALIETGEKWQEEWRGMPEFVQNDLMPFKSIKVHFETREDMEKFAKLVKQKINLTSDNIWYPEAKIEKVSTKRYIEKQ